MWISCPVPSRMTWAGARRDKWAGGEPSTDDWQQWNATVAKTWSDGAHAWRLVGVTLSESTVVEEWRRDGAEHPSESDPMASQQAANSAGIDSLRSSAAFPRAT